MRGMGQDGTRTLSPLQRITEVKGDFFFFFPKLKGGRTVNETEVKQSRRDTSEARCVCVCCTDLILL